MDTTRWGEGFPTGRADAVDDAAWRPESEPDAAREDLNYPFDEPETSPELQQQRSASLYTRNTPFWERVVELPPEGEEYPRDPAYWSHPERVNGDGIMRVREEKLHEKVCKRLTSRTALQVYAIVVLVTLLTLFLVSTLTTVRSIKVEGYTRFSPEQVIALSGLEVGMHSFSVDEELVRERIERERYLRCTLVDVTSDAVTLHIRERAPAATIVQNGRRAVLDERGWVLELSEDIHTVPAGLVIVSGLDVQHCTLGRAVDVRVPERLQTYMQIFIELRAMGGLALITELDMTSMDSITLKTNDGMTVVLGNELLIHEKIRAFLVVRENLIRNGFYGEQSEGTIIVSDPTSPAYRPPDV